MATIFKTKQGHWRAQVRRRGKYASNTFRLKSHADAWAVETERLIDLGGKPDKRRHGPPKTVADLVDLHMSDLQALRRSLRRSKHAVMQALKRDLGATQLSQLDRARISRVLGRYHFQRNHQENVEKLWRVKVLMGQRMPCQETIRQIGVTEQTFYRLLSMMLRVTCRSVGRRNTVE